MTTPADLDLLVLADQAWPTGGRLCQRALTEGKALVGLLTLPQDFRVEEGRSYVLVQHASRVGICREPLDDTLSDQHKTYDVSSLLRSPVWRGVTNPRCIVVKFMEAFPTENSWVVYGASNQAPPANAQSHTWWDVGADATVTAIEAPVDAVGSAMGQLLSMHPIWPNAQGELHTLSTLPVALREQYHRYHQLLVASTQDEALDATLEATVRKDPVFSQIGMGRVDRKFCRYLAALDALGGLTVDAPQTVEAFAAHEDLSRKAMLQATAEVSAPKPPRMR